MCESLPAPSPPLSSLLESHHHRRHCRRRRRRRRRRLRRCIIIIIIIIIIIAIIIVIIIIISISIIIIIIIVTIRVSTTTIIVISTVIDIMVIIVVTSLMSITVMYLDDDQVDDWEKESVVTCKGYNHCHIMNTCAMIAMFSQGLISSYVKLAMLTHSMVYAKGPGCFPYNWNGNLSSITAKYGGAVMATMLQDFSRSLWPSGRSLAQSRVAMRRLSCPRSLADLYRLIGKAYQIPHTPKGPRTQIIGF